MKLTELTAQMKILHPLATRPERGSPLAAGYDIRAAIDKPISVRAGDKATLIPTGLALFTNRGDVAGIILPRSSLGHKHGLVLGNTLGLIDGDYQNQWFVSAWNRGQEDEIIISPGDRIAQVIFVPVIHPSFVQTDEFTVETERGQGGFGSTGGFKAGTVPVFMGGSEGSKSLLHPMGSLGEEVDAGASPTPVKVRDSV